MTATANTLRAEFTAQLTESIERMEEQLERLSRALVGHNTVVQLSESMYIVRNGDEFGVTDIIRCSRWYPEDAAKLAAGARDGAGNVGKCVKLADALRTEIAATRKLRDTIQARA